MNYSHSEDISEWLFLCLLFLSHPPMEEIILLFQILISSQTTNRLLPFVHHQHRTVTIQHTKRRDILNTSHEQSLEELIDEYAKKMEPATKLRGFVKETKGIWPLESLKRYDYPEGIRFRSGKNYIYRTRALLRYLLTRSPRY